MRVSATSVLLALPLLGAAAEEGLFASYRARFQNLEPVQNILGLLGDKAKTETVAAAAAAAAAADAPGTEAAEAAGAASERSLKQLTLSNWKDTLYAPVQPGATTPEEWWVSFTGGNKTCFGRCESFERAYKTAAAELAARPDGPHTALIDCESEPVLCNSWSAGPGYLYIFELLPKPAPTNIYFTRVNLTTATPETILDLSKSREAFRLLEGRFHPLDGSLAVNGLAVPIGYFLWVFNIVPNWIFMIGVSFLSRTFMGRRAVGGAPRPGAPRPGGQ